MTLQDQITALCAEAEPLRARHDGGGDELRLIVDRINALRAVEAAEVPAEPTVPVADVDHIQPPAVAPVVEAVKRRGRPPKVTNA